MKKTLLSAVAFILGIGAFAQSKVDTVQFTVVKANPITSIKNQNKSGTCWAYSSLAFFESELLRLGKGEHDLAESFVVTKTMLDRATKAVRTHGDVSFSQGGSFYDVLYCLKHYGIVPQTAMAAPGSTYGDTLYNHNELDQIATAYVNAIAKGSQKTLSPIWRQGLEKIYDAYMGEIPATFTEKGKTYTPKSYAESLGLKYDDYVSLTSFNHEPFYSSYVIEVQDNWRWAQSYNLPIDELMRTMEDAVKNGYTFAWGADVSEDYFGRRGNSIAKLPSNLGTAHDLKGSDAARWTGTDGKKAVEVKDGDEPTVTQEMRQKAYDNWETTDDHGMQIYGLAKDPSGKEYFMVKNSWGFYGPYKGHFYASKGYVAYKTMNILIHKNAIPKDIRKKLGI